MYHERQRWAFCGIHAVNNLLQERKCDKAYYDSICEELSPSSSSYTNPHRSMFRVGNFDANVLMVVLQRHGLQVKWHDARQDVTVELLETYLLHNRHSSENNNNKGVVVATAKEEEGSSDKTTINTTNNNNNNNNNSDNNNDKKHIFGIVVNIPSNSWWARYVTKGRHWLTLLWMSDQQQWVNLDSDLVQPVVLGSMEACVQQLQQWKQRYEASCHILFVTS
jgi:Josephin